MIILMNTIYNDTSHSKLFKSNFWIYIILDSV